MCRDCAQRRRSSSPHQTHKAGQSGEGRDDEGEQVRGVATPRGRDGQPAYQPAGQTGLATNPHTNLQGKPASVTVLCSSLRRFLEVLSKSGLE